MITRNFYRNINLYAGVAGKEWVCPFCNKVLSFLEVQIIDRDSILTILICKYDNHFKIVWLDPDLPLTSDRVRFVNKERVSLAHWIPYEDWHDLSGG